MSQKHVIQPTARQQAREVANGHDLLQRLLAMSDADTEAWLRANPGDLVAVVGAVLAGLRDLHHDRRGR